MVDLAHHPRDWNLGDFRELLGDLYHEIGNQGSREGDLFHAAYNALYWLVSEQLVPDEARHE